MLLSQPLSCRHLLCFLFTGSYPTAASGGAAADQAVLSPPITRSHKTKALAAVTGRIPGTIDRSEETGWAAQATPPAPSSAGKLCVSMPPQYAV